MNEVNDGLRHNGLCLEGGREPGFEQRGIAETTGYDKHHSHERYQSHEGGKSQGSHIPGPHILEIEDATGKHTHLDPRLQLAPEILDIGRIELPDILVKAYDSVNEEKSYLCRRKAALGKLKASFLCARLHFLCHQIA